MKVSELVVRIVATGSQQAVNDLNSVHRAMNRTRTEAGFIGPQLNQIETHSGGLTGSMRTLQSAFNALTPELQDFYRTAIPMVALLGSIRWAMVGLTFVTAKWMWSTREAGEEFEMMEARLKGITRSAKEAKSLLQFTRELAIPSIFTTQQLEESTVRLAAQGVDPRKMLPVISKIGIAMGADEERLRMYTRAITLMATGLMPEAEVMSAMGVSKGEMAAKGVKFSANSKLLSDAKTTLGAFEKIVNEKYGTMEQEAQNTSAAIKASLLDAFLGLNREIGKTMNESFKPLEKSLASLFNTVGQSAFPTLLATNMTAPIRELAGVMTNATGAMKDLMSALAAMASIIPSNLAGAIAKVKSLADPNVSLLKKGENLGRLGSMFLTKGGPLGAMFDTTGKVGKSAIELFLEYRKSFDKKMGVSSASTGKVYVPPKPPPIDTDDDKKKTRRHLQKIENNTAKTADLLDLRKQTIGGGAIGSLGVTGSELAYMGMKARSEITKVRPLKGDTMVIRGIKDVVRNNIMFSVNGGQGMAVR